MDKSENKNTTKAAATWMNVYHVWAKHKGEVLGIEKEELGSSGQNFTFF